MDKLRFSSCITLPFLAGVTITIIAVTPLAEGRFANTLAPQLQKLFSDNDLDRWEPRQELKEKLPYVLSGYDYEGRPVWIMEFGKWKVKDILEGSEKEQKEVDKYLNQGIYRILSSVISDNNETDATDAPITKFRFIMDMDGFTVERLTYIKGVALIIRTLNLMAGMIPYCEKIYIINVSYAAKNLIEMVRPILAQGFPLMETYGSNPDLWRPALLKDIPAGQLPEWYGGNKGFKPLKVYG